MKYYDPEKLFKGAYDDVQDRRKHRVTMQTEQRKAAALEEISDALWYLRAEITALREQIYLSDQ